MNLACMPQAPSYIFHVRLSRTFTYQTAWRVYKSHQNVTSTQMYLGVQLFLKDKRAYCCWLMPYVLGDYTPLSAVTFSRAVMFPAMSASGGGMLFCMFEGSVFSIKWHDLRLGTTSLSASFLSLSLSFSLPHGSQIIHPPTDRCCAGGRCQSAKSMWCKGYACLCFACTCLFVHMNASVYICERV